MPKSNDKDKKTKRSIAPAATPEVLENRLVSLAMDCAEKQLRDGTASSQIVAHFLKLGSSRQELENQKLSEEVSLLKAKTEALESNKHIEELMEKAVQAMKVYQGREVIVDE